jgi:hypothetical protein
LSFSVRNLSCNNSTEIWLLSYKINYHLWNAVLTKGLQPHLGHNIKDFDVSRTAIEVASSVFNCDFPQYQVSHWQVVFKFSFVLCNTSSLHNRKLHQSLYWRRRRHNWSNSVINWCVLVVHLFICFI